MPLPIPAPSRVSRRLPAANGPGSIGAPGSYSSSPNLGGAGAGFGSPRTATANAGTGVTGSPLPTSRLMTPRAAGLGGRGTPGRIPGGEAAATTRVPMSLSSHQQLQQALQGGETGGGSGGEAVKVRGSPIPAEGLGAPVQIGSAISTSGRLGKTNGEEEPEDDGYDEDEEGADDEDGDVDDDEIMEEVTLSGILGTGSIMARNTGGRKSGLGEGGSGFFGNMEMDDNYGEKAEEDPDLGLDPDPETEEAPTTDTGEVGGSTTDDGARKKGGAPQGVSGLSRKTAPVPGRATRSSTRESDREREKKEKQARDKAKMPPPPPMVKRNPSAATRGSVKPSSGAAGKEGTTATTTTTSRVRTGSTATYNTATGGINRTTSVRKGSTSKDDAGVSSGTKSRSAAEAKTSSKLAGGTTANTTRHIRTRSVAGGAAPSLSSSTRQNGATTGTDSEDPTAAKRTAVRTGLVRKPRPVSMFVSSTTKAGTGGESDGAPPSPTIAAPPTTIGIRSRQPTGQSKDTASIARKPSTRAPAGTTTTATAATATQSHRRNQSEAQPSTQQKSSRPEFTTLQKDYTAPTAPPKQYLTETAAANAALLPDAPTLQKQTHLLQLLLLHNTAIQSFQSFHADAHTKLSKRYEATAELYRQVRERLCADARAADMTVLSNVLSATPAVPPIGGVARWGTASARRLSGSREHLARGDGRRKTLTGEMASPVEERIQVLSESVKRVEGLLRKGGEVTRVRAPFEAWIGARMGGKWSGEGGGGEEGLPRQWHRDWATVKRKLEVAVDGVKDFWVAYQHVLNEDGNGGGGNNTNGSSSSNGVSGGAGSGSGGTLVRMVLGFLELGEDVIRELDEMKTLERLWVDEARERMRKVVREVMMTMTTDHHDDDDDNDNDGGEEMEGVEMENAGSSVVGGVWRL